MSVWVLLLLYLRAVRSTRVFDVRTNDVVNKYCPATSYCPEGTHVMCMYYRAINPMGEHCAHESKSIPVTPAMQEVLLDTINQFRAQLANGNETGRDKQLLPRVYGLLRLKWDENLAKFAQVWANQCTIGFDLCRGTEKYRDPGQVVSMVRFTYPDWKTVSDSKNYKENATQATDKTLTDAKLRHTLDTAMRVSYHRRKLVTKEILEECPDLKDPKISEVRTYLTMIYKNVTHFGCGMSAYPDFFLRSGVQGAAVIYNVSNSYSYPSSLGSNNDTVELVCNFSGNPRQGTKVVETEPQEGSSSKCGCPPGTEEDADCLCNAIDDESEAETEPPETEPPETEPPDAELSETEQPETEPPPSEEDVRVCDSGDPGCQPSVVLLPIITVEDAPPEMLYRPPNDDDGDNPRQRKQHNTAETNVGLNSEILIPNNLKLSPQAIRDLTRRFGTESRHLNDVRNRYLDKQFLVPGQRYRSGGSPVPDRRPALPNKMHPRSHRGSSIFSRVSNFKLPSQMKSINNSNKWTIQTKKDVSPRKKKSRLQDIAVAYLSHAKKEPTSKLNNRPKFGIAGFNTTLAKRNFEIKDSGEEIDNKLLTLLDSLEEKVKHIKFKSSMKKIVDAKIRKIYNKFVGEGRGDIIRYSTDTETDIEDRSNEKLQEKYLNNDYAEFKIPEVEPTKLQRRHQNSITQYDYPVNEQYKNKYHVFYKDDTDIYGNIDKGNFKNEDRIESENKHSDKVMVNSYYSNDDDDLLSVAKRKYYQQKLDNIQSNLKYIRGYKHGSELKNGGHYFRPVLSPGLESRTSNQMDPFYAPERAKFHGF